MRVTKTSCQSELEDSSVLTFLTFLGRVLDDGDHLEVQVPGGGALHSDQALVHQSLDSRLQLSQGLGEPVLCSLSLSLQLSLSFPLLQLSHLGAGLTQTLLKYRHDIWEMLLQ